MHIISCIIMHIITCIIMLFMYFMFFLCISKKKKKKKFDTPLELFSSNHSETFPIPTNEVSGPRNMTDFLVLAQRKVQIWIGAKTAFKRPISRKVKGLRPKFLFCVDFSHRDLQLCKVSESSDQISKINYVHVLSRIVAQRMGRSI